MHHDLIVIGGGSGGLAAAKRAAHHGARVALVERDRLGGTCVNRGCVPKKLMWHTADTLHKLRNMVGEGLFDAAPRFDFKRHCDLRHRHVDQLRNDKADSLADAGVTHLSENATILGQGRVRVGDETLATDRILLATGAAPVRLDLPGAELVDVSDDVFGWAEMPRRLLVIGAGYVGCEFATIFCAFGSEVTLATDGERVLERFGEGVARTVGQNLERQGVGLRFGTKPTRIDRTDGGLQVAFDHGDPVEVDRVLIAIGRKPVLSALGPVEPKRGANGALEVDDDFATSVPGLFAVGDCAARLPLTPVAVADGQTMAERAFGDGAEPVPLNLVAKSAFVMPPAAEVGARTGEEAATYQPLVNAVSGCGWQGFWTLSREAGALSGIGLVGDNAHEAIGWAAQAQQAGLTRKRMDRSLAIHPSDAEEALR